MSGLESIVLSYVLNSLWQVPLIVLAAWFAARIARQVGPGAEHRVWVTALMAEALMPAISILPWERLNMGWPWHLHAERASQGSVVVQVGSGVASEGLQLPEFLFIVLIAAYTAATVYFAGRFAWRWLRLRQLAQEAEAVELDDGQWQRWKRRFEVENVALVSSCNVFAPLTMGIARTCVMLPANLMGELPAFELDTVIGHELAHVRRRDFAKNLVYEALSLAVSYHPGLWFTRQRLTESREMICDEMAARVSGNQEYAESLLRLARLLLQGKTVQVPHAIGVFDSSTLERRLMKLTEVKKEIGRTRRVVALGACVVLGVAAATSAVALRIGVDQKAADAQKKTVDSVNVDAKVMQTQLLTKITPVYPPEAKAAKVEGKVLLKAVIGKEGHVENLSVISGPSQLQQSALDAVRQWVYKPFLLNGAPVDVITKITVHYSLAK